MTQAVRRGPGSDHCQTQGVQFAATARPGGLSITVAACGGGGGEMKGGGGGGVEELHAERHIPGREQVIVLKDGKVITSLTLAKPPPPGFVPKGYPDRQD